MAIASTPAVGPRPTARTNSRAQTISGTLRRKISNPRTGQRNSRPSVLGRPLREAADNDSARLANKLAGTANSKARAIPAVAMASVCRVACHSNWRNSSPWAGGQKAETNRPISLWLSALSSTPRSSSLKWIPGHSRASANRLSSRRGRVAGSRVSRVSIGESAGSRVPPERAAIAIARWRRACRATPGRCRWQEDRTGSALHANR